METLTEAEIQQLENDIADLEEKIAQCQTASNTLGGISARFSKQSTGYTDTHNVLKNDSELMAVKRTDVLEGEMADALAGDVSTLSAQIDAMVAAIDAGRGRMDSLKSIVDTKKQELEDEKVSLSNQLP